MNLNSEIPFDKYSTIGAGYHWEEFSSNPLKMGIFLTARYNKCKELLLEKVKKLESLKILDIGCGDGVLTYLLAKGKSYTYGIDLDRDAIEFAKQKLSSLGIKAEFSVQSCYETNFLDSSFDAIVSSDVIEHLQNPVDYLMEIKRILKPGGWAVISTPIRITEFPEDKNHVIEWFPTEFEKIIKASFQSAEFRKSHPLFWYEIYRHSIKYQLPLNLLSYFKNPFLSERFWKHFCIQYAICKK
jgi:2-polyprenyl-3-methyl-5-hydroxy-6-metoxy-1,4-benzoquinol methylase